ncbi:O-antigen ligase family protein [Patescibacteria group bacterium]|nr:O-antigen ligase family protein [Patescibacteria group bacterium]
MLIADAFGVNPYLSFWSDYQHMDGGINLIHLFTYVVVLTSMLTSEKSWRRLFQTSLATSVLVGIYGLLQLIRNSPLADSYQTGSQTRIDSTFGNPDYFAAYLLFNVFIGAVLLVKEHENWQRHKLTCLIYFAITSFDIVMLFLAGSRGVLIGFFMGVMISLILVGILSRSKKIRMTVALVVLGIITTSTLLFLDRNNTVIAQNPILNRMTSFSFLDTSIQGRLALAEIAWRGFKERPLLGWGQENYIQVAFKYLDPRVDVAAGRADRPHNVPLQIMIDGGILGILAYLAVFATTLIIMWRSERFTVPERSLITGLIVGYFTQNLFLFDTVETYILFATILSYVAWHELANGLESPLMERWRLTAGAATNCALGVFVLACVIIWMVNGRALIANAFLRQALTQQPEGVTKNLSYFQQAIDLNSFGTDEIRRQLVDITAQFERNPSTNEQIRQSFSQYTEQQLEFQQNETRYPLDAPSLVLLGQLYDGNGNYSKGAQEFIAALTLSPRNDYILDQLAINAASQNDNTSTLRYLKQAFEYHPENPDNRFNYASVAILVGDVGLADELLESAILNGSAAQTKITYAYYSIGHPEKNIPIFRAYIRNNPGDTRKAFALAITYYLVGSNDLAIQAVKNLETVVPSIVKEGDLLIHEISDNSVPRAYIKTKMLESD